MGNRWYQPAVKMVPAGRVELWDGWSLSLPVRSHTSRNFDGSWSAWEQDREVHVVIVTVADVHGGDRLPAEVMLLSSQDTPVRRGDGCLWYVEQDVVEVGPGVWRVTVKAAAEMTVLHCTVTYRRLEDASWAMQVVESLKYGVRVS